MKNLICFLLVAAGLLAASLPAGAVTVSFAYSSTNANEGNPIVMRLTLSAVTNKDVTVSVARSGGTANVSDVSRELDIYLGGYTPQTIKANTLATNIVITTFHTSSLDEDNETVALTISAPVNATLGALTTCTGTIIDNDPPPTLSWSGSTGAAESFAAPAVELSANSGKPVTVSYNVTGGTATAGADYTLGATTLTILPEAGGTNLPLAIINDLSDEDTETIEFTMVSASNANLPGTSFRDHTYGISDNDNPPTISFSATSGGGGENVNGSVSINVSVPSGKTITGDLAVSGTARRGIPNSDYSLSLGSFTLPPGAAGTNATIQVSNDSRDEPDETVVLNLQNVLNATEANPSTFTHTINDNDNPPTVAFADNAASEWETNAPVVLVQLSQTSDLAPSVDYAVLGGTAGNGVDYVLATGTLVFGPTNSSLPIPFTLTDDGIVEPDETIVLQIGNPTNAALGGVVTNLFTIRDTGAGTLAPALAIALTATNTVLISWPSPSTGWNLQENPDLNTTNWVAPSEGVTDTGALKFIIVNPPTGNRFYRLFKP